LVIQRQVSADRAVFAKPQIEIGALGSMPRSPFLRDGLPEMRRFVALVGIPSNLRPGPKQATLLSQLFGEGAQCFERRRGLLEPTAGAVAAGKINHAGLERAVLGEGMIFDVGHRIAFEDQGVPRHAERARRAERPAQR